MKSFSGTPSFISIALPFAILLAIPASSQVRGSYSPGSYLTYGGTVSDPGFSYDNEVWYTSSNQLKGPQGNMVPIQGSVNFLFDNNSVIYVPKFKLLHANLEFSIVLVFSNGSFAARDPFAGLPSVGGTAVGLTNTDFLPIDLGWHFKHADLQTGYVVAAPTGRYVVGASRQCIDRLLDELLADRRDPLSLEEQEHANQCRELLRVEHHPARHHTAPGPK